MTFENSKRLYDHYIKIGNNKAAGELLNKYPKITGVVEEVVEDESSKGQKPEKKTK